VNSNVRSSRELLAPPSARRGAVLGGLLGFVLTVPLLVLGWNGGESAEGAALLAALLGAPVSLPLFSIETLGYPVSWVLFVLLPVPLNGVVLGALVGGVARALRWQTRLWVLLIPVFWCAVTISYGSYASGQ
jgi:hypothetical protein